MNSHIGDFVTFAKGKPPKETFETPGAELLPYLSPEYLRGVAAPLWVKPTAYSVHVEDGESIILWDGSNAGEIFRAKCGVLASTMAVARPKDSNLDSNYLGFALKLHEGRLRGFTAGSGIPHVDKSIVKRLPFRKPCILEQQAIAAALGHANDHIELIRSSMLASERAKHVLTAELLAGRISVDGTARTKADFWVHERLGKVPKGWKVARLRDLFRLKNGKSNITSNLRASQEGAFIHAVYGGNGMTGWSDRYFLSESTVVIGRVGEYCGAVHAVPPNSWITDNALYVEEHLEPFDVQFLFHLLKSLRLNRWKATTGQPKITQSEILNIRVAFPEKVDEQRNIAAQLGAFQDVIEGTRTKITALQRLKKSLMQNLLTGRMRLSPAAIAALTAERAL
jgi:type I restriction enzyme S subunit